MQATQASVSERGSNPTQKALALVLGRTRHAAEVANFHIRQRVQGVVVSDVPEFEPSAIPYFVEGLRTAKHYLEFGSGGSTVTAARLGIPFTCVESDKFFMAAVRRKVEGLGLLDDARQRFIHVDIGVTEAWGAPVIKTPNPERIARWRAYAAAPWSANAVRPDLILIDGRFRVSCALTAIRELGADADWTMLVDDYVNRDHYHVIEHFAAPRRLIGRMAVFGPRSFVDAGALDRTIERACADYR